MKRPLAVTFIVILLSVNLQPTFAAVRIGSKCTKVGATTNVAGKRLICTSKKKWQLAPKIVTPPPFIEISPPEPTRVIVRTPIEDRTVTLQRVSEGWVCLNGGQGFLQHLVDDLWVDLVSLSGWESNPECPAAFPIVPWATAPVYRGELLRWRIFQPGSWEWFSNSFEFHEKRPRITPATQPDSPLKVFSKVPVLARDEILGSPTFDTVNVWDVDFEETISASNRQYILENIQKAMPYVSRFLLRVNRIHFVVFSSRAWGLQKVQAFDKSDKAYQDRLAREFDNWGDRPTNSCVGAGGFTVGYLEHPVVVIDAPCHKWNDESFDVAAHELIHVIQSKWAFTLGAGCLAPTWWSEGQASAGSWAFAQRDSKSIWYLSRAEAIKTMLNPRTVPLSALEEPYLEGEYHNGAAALEYLIARSGWQQTFDVLRTADILAGRSCLMGERRMEVFKEAFKTIYGQTLEDFYTEVTPYLDWAYDNSNRL